ncbi:thioesterase II family protein [Pantoea agglomerans]|uniref:thioesterase II family protein n=1 Tax=Enterobacter agglomerans TaxID=549 RepID=UPI002542A657|nr:alpha/beta fold hydrolase [Pantoea agglomerans]MDK4218990.1 alpha/beta fold hydrolase [Pantoea agglomerans]
MRLICFPYAGGSTAIFRGLAQLLPDIEVHTPELPGRGSRMNEAAFTSIEELAERMIMELRPHFSRPFALFGHSMGAALSFEIVSQLSFPERANLRHLFVSACPAPGFATIRRRSLQDLNDADFIEELRLLGGTPSEILDNAELMALLLPMLRADFTAVENHRAKSDTVLDASVTALAGDRDERVTAEAVFAWRHATRGNFVSHLLQGDHFFLKPQFLTIANIINLRLAA